MRRLFQFLKRFRDFLVFTILQVFVLTLFINGKNYHSTKMTNTSSVLIGWFMEKKYEISKHLYLADANKQLMEENARLRGLLPSSYFQLQGNAYSVNDTLMKQQFEYIPATVINSTANKANNYFTLNRGSSNGIEIGMGVISSEGLIGIVIDVSTTYAIVMTMLSNDIKVNVKLKENNEYWLLNWDGRDKEIGQIQQVKRDVPLEIGDNVVTRGGDKQFPEGIAAGTISEIISTDGEQTISLNIKLAVNFNAVYHVYVIKNLLKNEQIELEDRILENE
jgi:rod shape-determining protein MreC